MEVQQLYIPSSTAAARDEPSPRVWVVHDLEDPYFTHANSPDPALKFPKLSYPFEWGVDSADFDEKNLGTCSHELFAWRIGDRHFWGSLRCEHNVIVLADPELPPYGEETLDDLYWRQLLAAIIEASCPLAPLPALAWKAERLAQKSEQP